MTNSFLHSFDPPASSPVTCATIDLDVSEIEDAGIREVLQTPGGCIWRVVHAGCAVDANRRGYAIHFPRTARTGPRSEGRAIRPVRPLHGERLSRTLLQSLVFRVGTFSDQLRSGANRSCSVASSSRLSEAASLSSKSASASACLRACMSRIFSSTVPAATSR